MSKNLISIVEIPVADFQRAVTFYRALLGVEIEAVDMEGTQLGVLPGEGNAVSVVLIKGEGYEPAAAGALVYLDGGEDLQAVLDKVEPNGGQVVVPKTEIDPETGFFAHFTDTEGNRLGLHSYQ